MGPAGPAGGVDAPNVVARYDLASGPLTTTGKDQTKVVPLTPNLAWTQPPNEDHELAVEAHWTVADPGECDTPGVTGAHKPVLLVLHVDNKKAMTLDLYNYGGNSAGQWFASDRGSNFFDTGYNPLAEQWGYMLATGNQETHTLTAEISDPCLQENWTLEALRISVRR